MDIMFSLTEMLDDSLAKPSKSCFDAPCNSSPFSRVENTVLKGSPEAKFQLTD